ncbi:major facilitator superfamily transporter [Apiospora saccharicola]|uniref:Major facilitator superfamily transporter n=1 Tax=Apiospora saccharicola TaxID=335842 RepID=A0ABR1UX32_9PEZI
MKGLVETILVVGKPTFFCLCSRVGDWLQRRDSCSASKADASKPASGYYFSPSWELPSVITSYFRSSNQASWLSTAFLLTSTAIQPVVGRLSDTIGRKPPYLFAMTVFPENTSVIFLPIVGAFLA